MKFTKQETSMIKVAAAFMAPQHKRAALQDKLAEYGIGLTKQAADLPDYMKQVPKPGIAQAANPMAQVKPVLAPERFGWSGAKMEIPADVPAAQGTTAVVSPDRKARLQEAFKRYMTNSASMTGYGLSKALRDKQPQPKAPVDSQPVSELPKNPMIGTPVPGTVSVPSSMKLQDLKREYPYAYQRWLNSPDTTDENGLSAMGNVRLFDNYLNSELRGDGTGNGVFDQGAVNRAREAQARSLARDVTAPGTNQYNDAVQMLIQAGRNNQEAFENTGKTPAATTQTGGGGIPENYTGPNRLNEEQIRQLENFYPAMGANGNAQRFANWG